MKKIILMVLLCGVSNVGAMDASSGKLLIDFAKKGDSRSFITLLADENPRDGLIKDIFEIILDRDSMWNDRGNCEEMLESLLSLPNLTREVFIEMDSISREMRQFRYAFLAQYARFGLTYHNWIT